jgi:RHS repeat-associated protein
VSFRCLNSSKMAPDICVLECLISAVSTTKRKKIGGPSVTLKGSLSGTVAADALRFVKQPASGGVSYILSDQLGQPRKMLDGAGALSWDRIATPFGETAMALGAASANILRFPGQQYDALTGLHYNYQRDYDPSLGRYPQSDPIGLMGGLNTYAYVGANPVSRIDPWGLRQVNHGPVDPTCGCDLPVSFFGQGGGGASIHVIFAGASGSITGAFGTGGQACALATFCGRFGLGLYIGAGGVLGGGAAFGNTDAIGGFSVGGGADIGTGPSYGFQGTIGVSGEGITSVGGIKGKLGGGFGAVAGLDGCYTWLMCTPCK